MWRMVKSTCSTGFTDGETVLTDRKRPVAILVTGSRDWTDEQKVREVLERFKRRDVTLVHGAYRGLDKIAERVARSLGFKTEPHPADWTTHKKRAGPIRNSAMVIRMRELRALRYECHVFAFPLSDSSGTWDCVNKAKRAGFEVEVIRG